MGIQYPALHAATHMPGGSDPITFNGIQFDITNTGIFIDIETSSYAAIIADSIQFQSTGTSVIPDWSASGTQVQITALADLLLQGYNSVRVTQDVSGTQNIELTAAGIVVNLNAGAFSVALGAALQMQVMSSTAAPIFEVREDGSIHGQAAIGAITWDL